MSGVAFTTGTFDPEHPDINTAYNYGYDALGNLVRDTREGITGIDWTVAGKVRSVAKATGPSLSFAYGAGGQRIMKQVGDPDNGGYREHYIRDAQGNIMAIYKYTNSGTASTKVVERPIYGSSRLGSYALAQEVMVSSLVDYPFTQLLSDVHKRYELNDHLGNVNTVVSGRLLDGAGAGSPKQAEVITASGYEPFGALLPGRNWRQPIGTPPPPVTAKGTLVITEFSNGPSGSCEYVEMYVTKCALYPDATEVDIRGWIIDDNAGNFNTSGLCGTGVAINSGHLRFADAPAWASVPVGTVIVVFNGPDPADNCYGFTVDESGTGPYFIDVNSTSLLQRTGTGGTPSSTDCGYCDNSYTTATWDPISLGNTADAIQVRCPDCPESEAGFFHGVAYGSGFGGLVAGANDLGGAYVPGPGGGRSYELTGTGSPGDGAQWTRIAAPAGGTPPTTAGVVDAGVVAGLESASLACCGSFEVPVLAQKQGYRWGFGGQMKDNEVYGAEGTSYTAEFWQYDPRVARRWNPDPLTYPWQSNYAAFNNNPIIYVDPLGLFGTRKEAREHKKDNNLKGRVRLNDDGRYSIDNRKAGTSVFRDEEFGIQTSVLVEATRKDNASITPFGIGVEWLTGKGARSREFTDGDLATNLYKQHQFVNQTRQKIAQQIRDANGVLPIGGDNRYDLSGIDGVGKYVKDYSTLATGGTTGNLMYTYLGSHSLGYTVNSVDVQARTAVVTFLVHNTSTIQSATRPPVIGYQEWYKNSIGTFLNNQLQSGPMSETEQWINWTETVKY